MTKQKFKEIIKLLAKELNIKETELLDMILGKAMSVKKVNEAYKRVIEKLKGDN